MTRYIIILLCLVCSASYADEKLTPVRFFDDVACDYIDQPEVSTLFQNTQRLQLDSGFAKMQPKLTVEEYQRSQQTRRASIAGRDIQAQGVAITQQYEENLAPNFIVTGDVDPTGNVFNLSISQLNDAQARIARASSEAAVGRLVVTAGSNNELTEFKYHLYQIVYLQTDDGLLPRRVDVSMRKCGDGGQFVSRLGDRFIQLEKASIPFRIFLPVPSQATWLKIRYGKALAETLPVRW